MENGQDTFASSNQMKTYNALRLEFGEALLQ